MNILRKSIVIENWSELDTKNMVIINCKLNIMEFNRINTVEINNRIYTMEYTFSEYKTMLS